MTHGNGVSKNVTVQNVSSDGITTSGGNLLFNAERFSSRRIFTIMFLDLIESTRLAESLDLDVYDERMSVFQEEASKIITQHNGEIVQLLGDGILAIFGLKQDSEDGAFSAATASLKLIKDLPKQLGGQKLRIGLHSDQVMFHEHKSAPELIVGFGVNLASRIQTCARPNSVLISEETLKILNKISNVSCGYSKIEPLKNVSKEQILYELSGVNFSERVNVNKECLGRDDIIAKIDQLEPSSSMLLIGAAGIGKTQIARHLVNRVNDDTKVVSWTTRSNVLKSPLFPIRQWLNSNWLELKIIAKSRLSDNDFAALETLLYPSRYSATLLGMDKTELSKHRNSALAGLLYAYLNNEGDFLLLDDLHWCDSATIEFVSYFLNSNKKVKTVIFTRPSNYEQSLNQVEGLSVIKIPSMCDEMLEKIAANSGIFLRSMMNPETILNKADGNPLYLLAMAENQILDGDDKLPKNIEASIQVKLDRNREYQDVLENAAVLGAIFPIRHLNSLSKNPVRDSQAIQELSAKGILKLNGPMIEFTHPLFHEVAYGMIPKKRSGVIHSNAVNGINSVDQEFCLEFPEIIADHAINGNDSSMVPQLASIAAIHLLKNASLDDAIYYLNQGLNAKSLLVDAEKFRSEKLNLLIMQSAAKVQKMGFAHPEVRSEYRNLEEEVRHDTHDHLTRAIAYYGIIAHRMISAGVRPCSSLLKASEHITSKAGSTERIIHLVHESASALYAARFDKVLDIGSELRKLYDKNKHSELILSLGADPLLSIYSAESQVHALRGDHKKSMLTFEKSLNFADEINAQSQLP